MPEQSTAVHDTQATDIAEARERMRAAWSRLLVFSRDGLPDEAMYQYHLRRYEFERDAYLRIVGAL